MAKPRLPKLEALVLLSSFDFVFLCRISEQFEYSSTFPLATPSFSRHGND